METKQDEGGPAFPQCKRGYATQYNGGNTDVVEAMHGGMTLRDYFAAKAMQASRARLSDYKSWNYLAADAYEIADAMLAARKATP